MKKNRKRKDWRLWEHQLGDKMNENFNIYTAIAYTSGKPHIGNTYEVVLADAIARYKRLLGYDVYFQTGTDEHGQKIAEKAFINNKNNQEFVDEVSLEVRRIWDVMNTSYDKFVRTTNSMHKEKVSKILKNYTNKVIYIKVFMRGYTVHHVNLFLLNHN